MNDILKSLKGRFLKLKYAIKTSPTDKIITIQLIENKFNRYLFPFVFMLHSNGFKPVLLVKNHELAHMFYDNYQRLIFKKGLLFKSSKNMNVVKEIVLDPDYFTALLDTEKRKAVIPMSMHPLIYNNNIKPLKNNKSNRIVLFAGMINHISHNKKQVFENIITRYQCFKLILKFLNHVHIKNKKDEKNAIPLDDGCFFLIYDRKSYDLNHQLLFEKLSKSSFFLALPGRGMPLCHNVIEAMFCGCIPIIQDEYAKMFPTQLENDVNCITYKKEEDFKNISKIINNLDFKTIEYLRNNVRKYYQDHLSPSAISKFILNHQNNYFYLQAEGRSISLYVQNKENVNKY